MMKKLRYRQVHLDFHTSGLIEEIGEDFDKKQFQEMLRKGHVNEITLFSKCHHGFSYHPTAVNERHPHLKFDLLYEQMEACKEIDVHTNVYLSAGLDEKAALLHPEWLSRQADESTTWVPDFITEAGYHLLCFNTGYLDLLLLQVKEVMERYHPSGIFLDISSVHPCYCSKCRQAVLAEGKDPRNLEIVMEQAEKVYENYAVKIREMIHKYNKDCKIFHNSGHMTRGRRDLAAHNTHLELESLPTGGWGYDHFPMSAAYVCNLDTQYLGMTGKFHSTWGEFGGFKHPNALRYETGLSLAFGAKCSIGDQLHPRGKMDEATYELIGKAYAEVETKEAWCEEAVNIADIGVLGDEAVNSSVATRDSKRYADIGANRVLLEGKYLYRFIDCYSDFNQYKLIILPDTIRLNETLLKRLKEYLQAGGKVLASGVSGLMCDEESFGLDFGAEFEGENTFCPDYVVPYFDLSTGHSPHVMYEQGYVIKITTGESLAARYNPYFNRDVYQFSSHQHTPNRPQKAGEAVVYHGKTAYIGWQIFSDYGKKGSLHLKELITHIIDQLLGETKTLQVEFPDRGVTTLTHQAHLKRYIHHMLFAHTTIRGGFEIFKDSYQTIEVIESIIPVFNTKVKLKMSKPIKKVLLVPQNLEIAFEQKEDTLYYTIPVVECHQMIAVYY